MEVKWLPNETWKRQEATKNETQKMERKNDEKRGMRETRVSAEAAPDLAAGRGFAPNFLPKSSNQHQTLEPLHWCTRHGGG